MGQELHGTCELLGPVAEGPEHGGGVSAQGHGIRTCSQGVNDQYFDDVAGLATSGDPRLQLLEAATDTRQVLDGVRTNTLGNAGYSVARDRTLV